MSILFSRKFPDNFDAAIQDNSNYRALHDFGKPKTIGASFFKYKDSIGDWGRIIKNNNQGL